MQQKYIIYIPVRPRRQSDVVETSDRRRMLTGIFIHHEKKETGNKPFTSYIAFPQKKNELFQNVDVKFQVQNVPEI